MASREQIEALQPTIPDSRVEMMSARPGKSEADKRNKGGTYHNYKNTSRL